MGTRLKVYCAFCGMVISKPCVYLRKETAVDRIMLGVYCSSECLLSRFVAVRAKLNVGLSSHSE